MIKTFYFLALLFTALTLAPSLAHLLELPNMIGLGRDDYLTVLQIYSGWAMLGIVIFAALLSSLILAILMRRDGWAFALVVIAFLCLAGGQVVFWRFTFPANAATQNWTALPENWMELRRNWEYSHAAGALLNLAAMVALIISVLLARSRGLNTQ